MTDTTITPAQTDEMRDVLVEMGYVAAAHAPADKVHARIDTAYRGGLAGFLSDWEINHR